MDQRINVVTLVVTDLAAARRFYVDALGWTPSMDAPEILMVRVGEKLILSLWAEHDAVRELGPVSRGGGRLPVTLAYNTSSPEEVDAVLDAAASGGATVRAAVRRDWGGYSGYFDDPCGFTWEVAHNPFPIGDVTLP